MPLHSSFRSPSVYRRRLLLALALVLGLGTALVACSFSLASGRAVSGRRT